MPLFSSRAPRAPAAGQAAASSPEKHPGGAPYAMNTRPSFGQWVKYTWLDIFTMACMGALGLGIYMAHPAPTRSFAVTFSDNEVVYPQFAYPLRHEIVPIWLAAVLASLVPIFVMLCMQIRVRSFWDFNNGVIGLLYALITAAVFQVFVKWLIGGLRPHFLAVCKPDVRRFVDSLDGSGVAQPGFSGRGFNQIYVTQEVCTGDRNEIDDSLESFPSGHTTAGFAGFVFLYLYLNAKLKVWSNYHPSMWKLLVTYMPILGATLIGGALTIDEYHNWYDIFAGAAIGIVMAVSAYRMTYAAVWDWRYNHIPLSRVAPYTYGYTADTGFVDSTFTHQAGWGRGRAERAWSGDGGGGGGQHVGRRADQIV